MENNLSLEAFNATLKENKLYREIDEDLENFLLNFVSYYESEKQSNKHSLSLPDPNVPNTFTNKGNAPVTVNGEVIQPGESRVLSMSAEDSYALEQYIKLRDNPTKP